MLILWRSLTDDEHQTLYIGDSVTVKPLQIEGGQAQLGIIAPRDVKVKRANTTNDLHKRRG